MTRRDRVVSVRLTEAEWHDLRRRGPISDVIRNLIHRQMYPAVEPLPERRNAVIVWPDETAGATWPELQTAGTT